MTARHDPYRYIRFNRQMLIQALVKSEAERVRLETLLKEILEDLEKLKGELEQLCRNETRGD